MRSYLYAVIYFVFGTVTAVASGYFPKVYRYYQETGSLWTPINGPDVYFDNLARALYVLVVGHVLYGMYLRRRGRLRREREAAEKRAQGIHLVEAVDVAVGNGDKITGTIGAGKVDRFRVFVPEGGMH